MDGLNNAQFERLHAKREKALSAVMTIVLGATAGAGIYAEWPVIKAVQDNPRAAGAVLAMIGTGPPVFMERWRHGKIRPILSGAVIAAGIGLTLFAQNEGHQKPLHEEKTAESAPTPSSSPITLSKELGARILQLPAIANEFGCHDTAPRQVQPGDTAWEIIKIAENYTESQANDVIAEAGSSVKEPLTVGEIVQIVCAK